MALGFISSRFCGVETVGSMWGLVSRLWAITARLSLKVEGAGVDRSAARIDVTLSGWSFWRSAVRSHAC